MKRTGKGRSISINEPNRGGTNDTNAWKSRMEAQWGEPPMPVFKPLAHWPAVPHARQSEIDAVRLIPSRFA